jgi:hypothetical protein
MSISNTLSLTRPPILHLPPDIIASLHTYCYIPQNVCTLLDLNSAQRWLLVNTWLKWLYSEGFLTPIYQSLISSHSSSTSEEKSAIHPVKRVAYNPATILPQPDISEINRLFMIYRHHYLFFEAARGRKINRKLICIGVDHGLTYVPFLNGVIWSDREPNLSCLELLEHIISKRSSLMDDQIVIPLLSTCTSNKYWVAVASLSSLKSENGALLLRIWSNTTIIRDSKYYFILVAVLQEYLNNYTVSVNLYPDLSELIQLVSSREDVTSHSSLRVYYSSDPAFWNHYQANHPINPWFRASLRLPRPIPMDSGDRDLRWRLLQEWLAIEDNQAIELVSNMPVRGDFQLDSLDHIVSSADDLFGDLDQSMIPEVSSMTNPRLDALTEQDFTFLWQIYVHEISRNSVHNLDTNYISAKIQQGLRYRPFLCKLCKYTQWWPSEFIAIISEVEEFENLDRSLYIQAEFPMLEWRVCYPSTFLHVGDSSSGSLLADLDSSEKNAILATEIYLQNHNISRVKYPDLLEQLGLQYHWCLLTTLYSSSYDLLLFTLENRRDKILDHARSDDSKNDFSSWSKLLMRNQASGFVKLILTYFKNMNPLFAHSLYSGLLAATLSMPIIDSRLIEFLVRENLSRWITDFVAQYGGYFASQSTLQVLKCLPQPALDTLFRDITDGFHCMSLNTPSTNLVFSSICKRKTWRPEDLLEILRYLKSYGLHFQYLAQLSKRDDSRSITWILESLSPPRIESTTKRVTNHRETRSKRKRGTEDSNDEETNDETLGVKKHNAADSRLNSDHI